MTSIKDKGQVPLTYRIEPRRARGLESSTEVTLRVDGPNIYDAGNHHWPDIHLEIPFDKASALDPVEANRLRHYLMGAPSSELGELFGKAIAAVGEASDAQRTVQRQDTDRLVLEGGLRGLFKVVLLAGILAGGPVGAVGIGAGVLFSSIMGAEDSLKPGNGKVLAFVKGALDLSYLQRLFDAVLGGNKAKIDALAKGSAAKAELGQALDALKAQFVDVAKGKTG